ncbi:Uncharacterised protein [Aeromonas encheleia]|jgi:hypothetical protein|nr:Uncharacterised protein [Aeromonas encheleia]
MSGSMKRIGALFHAHNLEDLFPQRVGHSLRSGA